jgi:hypothetical protein
VFTEVGTEIIFFRTGAVVELESNVVLVIGISVVVADKVLPTAVEFSVVGNMVTVPILESVVVTIVMLGFSIIPFSCSC